MLCYVINTIIKSVLSSVRQLTTWHCPHAARLLLQIVGSPAVQQSIDVSWPPGPQQQTRSSGVRLPNGGTDRQTDGRTPDRFMHTARAVSEMQSA